MFKQISSRTVSFCCQHLKFQNILKDARLFSTTTCLLKSLSVQTLEDLQKSGIKFGQPTPFSHPHLLQPNELVVGVTKDEFVNRRNNFIANLQKLIASKSNKTINNIVIIPASSKKYMSDVIPYVFRQNSDFFYLTGCMEPDSVLMFVIDETNNYRSILFMRTKNDHDELWDGPRTGVDYSLDFFDVDEAYSVTSIENFIEKFIERNKQTTIWYDDKANIQTELGKSVKRIVMKNGGNNSIETPTEILHELRVIKSPAEINLMRKTCEIASDAINQTMKESKPGDSEHHIFARVDYYCRMRDASFLAYPPVVATGNNANVIHYINNTQKTFKGELVLMDAGCEFGGYSSDITRTWPIDGHFTAPQLILYEIISLVQTEILNTIPMVEKVSLNQLYDLMCYLLGKYLQEVGLIDKSLESLAMARAAAKFCPHHVSHYLGMDVHDTPLIQRNRTLEPGMIFTVEPAIYIDANNRSVPSEFRGIGIRIEDDVLYGKDREVEILTQKCVKNVDDLKKLITI